MKTNLDHSMAELVAKTVMLDLLPGCERIEIAGSLRRGKPQVGDIELVCIPETRSVVDLFGSLVERTSCLDETLSQVGGRMGWRFLKNGPLYKQIDLGPIVLDLFITTREQWGVIYTLRTGPADFGKWLVTPRRKGGALPGYLAVRDGRVWNGDWALDTPEEADFFQVLGLDWIEPGERAPRWPAFSLAGWL